MCHLVRAFWNDTTRTYVSCKTSSEPSPCVLMIVWVLGRRASEICTWSYRSWWLQLQALRHRLWDSSCSCSLTQSLCLWASYAFSSWRHLYRLWNNPNALTSCCALLSDRPATATTSDTNPVDKMCLDSSVVRRVLLISVNHKLHKMCRWRKLLPITWAIASGQTRIWQRSLSTSRRILTCSSWDRMQMTNLVNRLAGCLCALLPLENLLWVKLRDYAISRVNTWSRAIGTWSPRSSVYRPFVCQAWTSRLPEPTPLTVYRTVFQVPPPLCSYYGDYTNAHKQYIT
jgi:hypothetical protein